MTTKRRRHAVLCGGLLVAALLVAGCASTIAPETLTLLKKPVDCSTAEEDIKRLSAAKPDGVKQTMTLAQTLSPSGLVVGLVTEDLDNRKRVISGEHGEDIDRRIAQMARTCGIRLQATAIETGGKRQASRFEGSAHHQDALRSDR
ncbi:MAG: hypothetical protein KJS95_08400 [Gammaproteobacteria bacterium]|nr:hypothetical protein [Gammaproteobacteria bacterium]